ncbi:MAG: family PLP-dependent enzyme [Nocardioides sp.]|jgi:D-serine deaminase-like pyridoxal phosphate-dependent protein|uniref:alanine racemase n=1 Tax=Nocardioides sp. TaxID=35761 RepID=UPI0026286A49|nr:alanine racemase [Nocardioides sp.]MCW2834768.1 family PLP-dependent enzyme [Nocardioides sp.]
MSVDVATPEVLIHRARLDANIARMADATASAGIGLRPHVKTHKVLEIARSQLAAGAVGLTVATVGEAEVFVADGATDVLIAYPLWATSEIGRRLQALVERATITVGVDSPEGAANLAQHLGASASRIEAWVEVDSGHHRSGVRPGSVEEDRIADGTGLGLTGVFTFPGHGYLPGQAKDAARQEGEALSSVAARLRAAGHDIRHASGGSSPSVAFSSPDHVTEVRPGVYALGDAQQFELGRCGWDDIALSVATTVVSQRVESRELIANAGSKVLGSDRPAWTTGYGRVLEAQGARVTALSEHHATVRWPDEGRMPALGEQIRLIPNHVCLTMNLLDEVAVVEDDIVVDRWVVAARGRNR